MKRKIRAIITFIFVCCLMITEQESFFLYADGTDAVELQDFSTERTDGEVLQENQVEDTEQESDMEQVSEQVTEKELETGEEQKEDISASETDRKIVSFDGFGVEADILEISDRPSKEELIASFPQTVMANLEDGSVVELTVQWDTTEDYETEWEEIIFVANVDTIYLPVEGTNPPSIRVVLSSQNNEGIMSAEAATLDGSGTAVDPFLIYAVEDLAYVREHNDEGIYYKLMNDIDLATVKWEPLGKNNEDPFCSYFDGNGHKIYNLNKIPDEWIQYGIFGDIKNATICNLEISVMDGVKIEHPNNKGYNEGGLFCRYGNRSTIYNCRVFGDYSAVGYSECSGLIAAQFSGGTISNCLVQGYVYANGHSSLGWGKTCYVGGIAGKSSATITDCISYVTVVSGAGTSDDNCVGGICGGGNATINNCIFVGETLSTDGKIVGQIYGDTKNSNVVVNNSYYVSANSADMTKEKFGEGKAIPELRMQETYHGWDFANVWTMDDPYNAGFPMLKTMFGIERPVSKYILPTVIEYSEGTEQTLLSNSMELSVFFDRDIAVEQNTGVYFADKATGDQVKCSYSVRNGNELHIATAEKLLNGKTYKLVITSQCVQDAVYSGYYSAGEDGEFEVSVCKPEFEGDGSAENPYQVGTIEQLNCVYYQPSKNYVLVNDIDASTVNEVNSIGGCKRTNLSGIVIDYGTYGEKADFSGTFDGQNHVISGIKKFSGQCVGGLAYDHYIGLFASTKNATIKNLTVSMADDCYKYNERQGTIVDVHGYPYVAILVARGSGTISNCTVQGQVYSNQKTICAGLLAGLFNGQIENCVAFGSVSNEYNSDGARAGGLVGTSGEDSWIRNSYAIASVVGAEKVTVGGLTGNNKGVIEKTYSVGEVSQTEYSGGLAGMNSGTVLNSYYDSVLSGKTDEDKGIPKKTSAMKLMETYSEWDFIDCWTINSKCNGGYPYLIGNESASKISASPTMIAVLDGVDGTTVIENPVIKLLDAEGEMITQYQGDGDGVITMPDIILNRTYSIEIVADGYGPYLNESFRLKAFQTHIVMLYPQTDKPVVYCANLRRNDKPSECIDVLQKTKVLSQQQDEKYSIAVAATYSGGIKDICLTQCGKLKMRSKTGIFENIDAQKFECDKYIGIIIVGEDGVVSDEYNTYLTVSPISSSDFEFSGSLGHGKIEIRVPSDVPFLGGAKISISDILEKHEVFQVGMPSEGKIRFSVNLKASESCDPEDEFPVYEEMKKLLEYDSKGSKKYIDNLEEFVNRYQNLIEEKDFLEIDKAKIKAKVFGYLEVDLGIGQICGGKIAVYIGYESNVEKGYIIGDIPIMLICEFSAKAEGTASAKLYTEDQIWDLSFNPEIKLSIGSGIGVPKLASLTVNGSGEIGSVINYNTYTKKNNLSVNATLELYLKLKILSFQLEQSIARKEYNIYDSSHVKAGSSPVRKSSSLKSMDENAFFVNELIEDSPWNDTHLRRRSMAANTDMQLLSSVYDDSQPQIVRLNDNKMMLVYLHQNASRTAINATEVVYSIYDGATQNWSTPKAIADDGTADFYPMLIENMGEVYVVWENMSAVADDQMGLSEFAALGQVSIAKYDVEKDTFAVATNSSAGGMISNPCANGGKLIWVCNETDDFLNDSAYSIQIADYDGNTISNVRTLEAGISHLISAKIGENGSDIVVAYIYDQDGDYMTLNDHVMKVVDIHGNTLYESVASRISEIEFIHRNGQNLLAYGQDGAVMVLNNDVSEVMVKGNIPVTNGFSYVDGDADYILFEVPNFGEDSEMNLYAYSCDAGTNSWNNAVPVTNTRAQITAYDAVACDYGVQIIYQETTVKDEIVTASLHTKKIEPAVNLGISNIVYDEEWNKISISADICNCGLKPAAGYVVTVYDGAEILYNETRTERIGRAETVVYEFELETTSINDYEKTLDFVVTPVNEIELDDSDNSVELLVGYPDVSIALEDESISERVYAASLELHNKGNCTTSGKINVYVYEDLVETIPVDELAKGEYRSIPVQIASEQCDFNNYVGIAKFEFVSDRDEWYLHDNSLTTNVYAKLDAILETVETEDVTVKSGGTAELPLTFHALNGKDKRLMISAVEYSLEDETVASVGEDGIVTGLKEGTTALTIVASDSFGNTAAGTCVINVISNSSGGEVSEKPETGDNTGKGENPSKEPEKIEDDRLEDSFETRPELSGTGNNAESTGKEEKTEGRTGNPKGEEENVVTMESGGAGSSSIDMRSPETDSVGDFVADSDLRSDENTNEPGGDQEEFKTKKILGQYILGGLLVSGIILFVIILFRKKKQDEENEVS